MTDFAALLQPDKGQSARTIHVTDKHGFDAWLAGKRGGSMAGALEAFPDGTRFRAGPALPWVANSVSLL